MILIKKNKNSKPKNKIEPKNLAILAILVVSIVGVTSYGFVVLPLSTTNPSTTGSENDYTEIIGDQIIRYDWLTIEMAEDNAEHMKHNIGGMDLIDFDNLESTVIGDNTFKFMVKIDFGYEINSYLSLDMDNVFPELDTNKMSSYIPYAEISVVDIAESYTAWGKFRYNYVDLGEHVDNDYDLNIPMIIGINPTFSALDGTTVNDITIKTSGYLHEVKSMNVVEAREGKCGDYNDLYTSQEEESGEVSTFTFDDDLSLSQTAVINKIESLGLGWKTGMTSEYLTEGITIQEWQTDSFTTGEDRTNIGTGNLIYNYPIELQPEITYTRQRIDVRTGGFTFYPFSNVIAFVDATEDYDINRIISAHVNCPFVHLEYKTTVYLICNVELDAEMYESALDDPFFRKGDWIWDPIIESWDPVVVVLPTIFDDLDDWWDKWGWLVITIIVLTVGTYLFIQIGLPLILKKQAMDVVRR